MVNCNFTIGIDHDDLMKFDEKRKEISRSSVIRTLIKAWINGEIEIKSFDAREEVIQVETPIVETPKEGL
jgi:hypothetical protein